MPVLFLFLVRTTPAVGLASCTCGESGASMSVPDDLVTRIHDIRASGTACPNGKVACTNSRKEGCAFFHVPATAEGMCHIEVEFDTGEVFERDVRLIEQDGCECRGQIYPESEGTIAIAIPE